MKRELKPAKDNTHASQKIQIRKRILAELNTHPSVLECFAGEGKLYRSCYQGMQYLGLDRKKIRDGRNVLTVDNVKYLRSADLTRFNVFDLDAYGSPWHQFLIILKRRPIRPGERIAIFLTCGLSFTARMDDLPLAMKPYCGLPEKLRVPCLGRHLDDIRTMLVVNACKEAGLTIETALMSHGAGRAIMFYGGLILTRP